MQLLGLFCGFLNEEMSFTAVSSSEVNEVKLPLQPANDVGLTETQHLPLASWDVVPLSVHALLEEVTSVLVVDVLLRN